MPVTNQHPDFTAMLPAWILCRDVAGGPRSIKAKGTSYLPRNPGQSNFDYQNYLVRAALFPAFARTVTALAGAVCAKPAVVEGASDRLLGLLDDVDLRGSSVDDLKQSVVSEVLRVGRAGLLVDVSSGDGNRPYVSMYSAENVISWRVARVGGDPSVLVRVVIQEFAEEPGEDTFEVKTREQFRVLEIDEEGKYTVTVWRQPDPKHVVANSRNEWFPQETFVPTRRGKPLDFIPFTFVGAFGTTPDVSSPPLEELAGAVIGHYRNSADHELGLLMTALPTYFASGLDNIPADPPATAIAAGLGGVPLPFAPRNTGLSVGPNRVWLLPVGGRAGVIEFSGAGLAAIREAMTMKEKHMATLGARILLDEPHAQVGESATSARLRYSAESASLRTIASSVAQALTTSLRTMEWWESFPGRMPTVKVSLPTDFFNFKASADEVRAALMAYQSEAMSFESFYSILQQGGWTRPGTTVEQERRAIQTEPPLLTAGEDVEDDEQQDEG